MIVARIAIVLRLASAASLKDKRSVVKSLRERLRQRFNVAVAEVGAHDDWRRAELGLALVAADGVQLDREIDRITHFLDDDVRFEMIEREVERY